MCMSKQSLWEKLFPLACNVWGIENEDSYNFLKECKCDSELQIIGFLVWHCYITTTAMMMKSIFISTYIFWIFICARWCQFSGWHCCTEKHHTQAQINKKHGYLYMLLNVHIVCQKNKRRKTNKETKKERGKNRNKQTNQKSKIERKKARKKARSVWETLLFFQTIVSNVNTSTDL